MVAESFHSYISLLFQLDKHIFEIDFDLIEGGPFEAGRAHTSRDLIIKNHVEQSMLQHWVGRQGIKNENMKKKKKEKWRMIIFSAPRSSGFLRDPGDLCRWILAFSICLLARPVLIADSELPSSWSVAIIIQFPTDFRKKIWNLRQTMLSVVRCIRWIRFDWQLWIVVGIEWVRINIEMKFIV